MNAPFRLQNYAPIDPDQAHWHEPRRPAAFATDVSADLREFNRISIAGAIAGLIAAALIWWLQS